MPPPVIIDIASIDLDQTVCSGERIYREFLPHRHEFRLLDGICHCDPQKGELISYCDIREDAWWTRGHIPGRPLLPGVLMLEAAAHTATADIALSNIEAYRRRGFLGLGGVDQAKFRDAVMPPARLYILCVGLEDRPRRFIAQTQGIVNGKMVFEAKITGIVMV